MLRHDPRESLAGIINDLHILCGTVKGVWDLD
jgi:hypothetical protein